MKLLMMFALGLWLGGGADGMAERCDSASLGAPTARVAASFGGGFGGVRRTAASRMDPFAQGNGGSQGG